MDIDTRLLRYFAAVAEEGHLTRAAERLYVAQPTLTKQIKQLENQLDVELFERSRTGMTLTEGGRILATRVGALLSDWDDVLRETQRAASQDKRTLRVGFIANAAGEATQHIITAFTRIRPGWRIEMRNSDWTDPTAGLADGTVDVALVRPHSSMRQEFRTEVLFTEPRWVALTDDHPLAALEQIPLSSLRDEPFVAAPPATGSWRDYWMGADECEDHHARVGAIARNSDEWLTAIASGYGISLTPASSASFYQRPGITYRPCTGISPTRMAVAWAVRSEDNPALRDFVRCCLSAGSRPPGGQVGSSPTA
ncbi:DNA-binding transcriptional LysR family regulator [Actinomadura pelletieri DSM 43383]|uniref:DNA-binding transcriptional LysR family regulator n=1 Tax=Actinomadura pelletieri DSM 43383 TaxID=1120940 RepID=A0A495QA39_9ACTN|nr:LysR family transcriptional regulator [Actinomadura pelletieri]RKS68335.1 DNA-binding transcriptional LysR family regulator [Actinomadura pelletieri DSM 43383]